MMEGIRSPFVTKRMDFFLPQWLLVKVNDSCDGTRVCNGE